MRPARAGEAGDVRLSIGQLELSLDIAGVKTRYGVRMDAGLSLDVVANTLGVTVEGDPLLEAWVIESDLPTPTFDGPLLTGLLQTQLWPMLTAAVQDGLAFELPALSPGDLGDLAPGLADLTLNLQSVGRPVVRGDSLVVDLALLGELGP